MTIGTNIGQTKVRNKITTNIVKLTKDIPGTIQVRLSKVQVLAFPAVSCQLSAAAVSVRFPAVRQGVSRVSRGVTEA